MGKVEQLRAHAYAMAGVATVPPYPLCATPSVSNVQGDRQQRTVFWRGGSGCATYEIERNDKSKAQDDANWKALVHGVNDFTGYWLDTSEVTDDAQATYYRIHGATYDGR